MGRLMPGRDSIRLAGSLRLPARRAGNRLRERGDLAQQRRSMALDPGPSQALDPGQGGRGRRADLSPGLRGFH